MRPAVLVICGLLGACLLLPGAARSAGAERDVPLPPGTAALREPMQVDVGSATLDVTGFLSPLEEQALIEFYRQALPEAGWRLAQLPWQADHAAATERLERATTLRRDLPSEVKTALKNRLTEFRRTKQTMQRQIYASRGAEHVIVNLWPMGEHGVAVFVNRWRGDRSWLGGPGRPTRRPTPTPAPSEDQGGSWPLTNVCCSGEEVPDLVGSLPSFVPRYPNAKAVARSTPASGKGTTVLLMAKDPAGTVAAYYRAQMPQSGWTLLQEEPADPLAQGTERRMLTYGKLDRICVLTIQGVDSEAQTLITVAVGPRPTGRLTRQ